MTRNLLLALFILSISGGIFAQNGTLMGKVTDSENGEPIPFANVSIMQNGSVVTGGMTDFDGKYKISSIPAGKYDLKASYMGYKSLQLNGLKIISGKIIFQNFKLSPSTQVLQEVEIKEYKVPLISKDATESGGTVTSEDIAKMPGRSAASVATTVGGVYSENGQIGSIRGARSEATVYYVDGVKVRGTSAVPKSAMEEVAVITGGLPAKYGDATGGIISITTKGPSRKLFGGAEVVTSHFLDPYDYNLVELTVSGPMLFKKEKDPNDSTKVKKTPIAGYFVSASFNYQKDRYPSAIGNWALKEDTLAWFIENPLVVPDPGSFVSISNAAYFRAQDAQGNDIFENVKAQKNIDSYIMNIAGKVDYKPSRNTNLTLGGTVDYRDQKLINRGFQLFNWDNNGHGVYTNWRTYLRFTQKFTPATPEEAEKAMVKNAFYQIQIDYTKTDNLQEDYSHKDNLFNYGYVGKFTTQKINSYEWTDTLSQFPSGIVMHNGFRDVQVDFEPSDINPVLSKYTEFYYGLYDPQSIYYRNYDFIELGGGLLNGAQPNSIYGIWSAPGTQYNSYSISDNSQFRISASGSADVKDHEISIGFEFEQRSDRYYGVAPVGLWTLARNYMNFHILELDFSNPIYSWDAAGVLQDTIKYNRKYNQSVQAQFDEKFREHLGKDIDGTEWIDIDAYDPSEFSIDFFSADELLNSGNSYVTYYGYDHHGNRLKSKPSFKDFFDSKDENGRFLRPIAPFEPNYAAAYIQDKFAFNDLIFNVGLRVDRFDANQKVLKDPYTLYEAYDASYLRENGIDVPNNIADNNIVYVDDASLDLQSVSILGYRSGYSPADVKWYDATGTEVDNYQAISASTGITPYVIDPDADLNENSFEDYDPQITMMPRISFSFPISDVALFFAHYDVLSIRPTAGARLNPLDYLFIETNNNTPINNPNLKPEKTIDYELGFQQKLTNTSSLKFAAFYREMRDMIQTQFIYGAYPKNYITYANIDFGTVKGFTVTYDLRRTGNVSLRASYTLQFANGTGSNAESGLSLIRTGQPNLRTTIPLDFDQRHAIVATFDYRYLSGRAYTGPKWFGTDIFQNTGANFVINFGTGSPYSRRDLSTDYLIGSLNGSRKPSRTTVNMRVDRTIDLELGKDDGDKKKTLALNLYFDISNLFNTKNVINVYSKTGNPDDDGYLMVPRNQAEIESQYDPEAFRNYYTMSVNSPYNYSLPRMIRFGAQIMF